MRTRSMILGLLVSCAAFGDLPPEPKALPSPPETLRAGFEAIEEADLRAWVGFLASDELEGRETGRRGYDVAARFCASLFERYGLRPAGDQGTFFQSFEVVRTEIDQERSALEVKDSTGADRLGVDGNLALAEPREVDWSGVRWTFAGHGERAESDGPDDLKGVPVGERVVLVLPRPDRERHEGRGALTAGAKRIAIVSDRRVKNRRGLSAEERPAFLPERHPGLTAEIVYISTQAANRLLRARNVTVEGLLASKERLPRFDLDGVDVRLSMKRKRTSLSARNVAGILEGSDPTLRGGAVVISAHLDHVGVRDGKIYRGADDDASGSSGVVALARAFAQSPRRPARSVIFLLFAGEEKGLWGSRYFVDRPAVPLDRIVCQIQLDMIGRNEERPEKKEKAEENTNSVHVVGAQRRSHDLHRAVLEANRYIGLNFEYDEEDVYSRSDQFSFGERGIPVTFFFTGFHPDYHQPGDTADKINYAKMARILRVVFATAFDVADRRSPLARSRRL